LKAGFEMLCFFDIDGTLVGFGRNELIPSTQRALARTKENGHQLLICTGRSLRQIPAWLKENNLFDGIVASAGAHVIYHGAEIYFRAMSPDTVRRSIHLFTENEIPYTLQGEKHNYFAKAFAGRLVESLAEKAGVLPEQIEKLFGDYVLTTDPDGAEIVAANDAILGMLYEKSPFDHERMRRALGSELNVNPSSFNKPDPYSGEITQSAITKAAGIKTVMEHLHVPREETAAFGDGHNDIEMLQFAGIGVAMGNAPDAVKAAADLVTDSLESDGLYHAMQKLHLVE